jgi:hypothetical protein
VEKKWGWCFKGNERGSWEEVHADLNSSAATIRDSLTTVSHAINNTCGIWTTCPKTEATIYFFLYHKVLIRPGYFLGAAVPITSERMRPRHLLNRCCFFSEEITYIKRNKSITGQIFDRDPRIFFLLFIGQHKVPNRQWEPQLLVQHVHHVLCHNNWGVIVACNVPRELELMYLVAYRSPSRYQNICLSIWNGRWWQTIAEKVLSNFFAKSPSVPGWELRTSQPFVQRTLYDWWTWHNALKNFTPVLISMDLYL